MGNNNTLDKFIIHFLTAPLANENAKTTAAVYDSASRTFEVDITLDSTTAKNATDLFIATSLIHEVIHAYLSYLWGKMHEGATAQDMLAIGYVNAFNEYVDTLLRRDSLNLNMIPMTLEPYHHNYMANKLLNYIADMIKSYDNNSLNDDRYYWYLAWTGLARKQVKVWNYHWPNWTNATPSSPIWPPANPAPVNDSTRGLKYALTLSRLDSIYNIVRTNEELSLPGAKGKKPVPNGCY